MIDDELDRIMDDIMDWPGVVGVGQRIDGLAVYLVDEDVALPSNYEGYPLIKVVVGNVVASHSGKAVKDESFG